MSDNRVLSKSRLSYRLLLVITLLCLVILSGQLTLVKAGSSASASTAGFGAAFGYAQNIAGFSFTQAGSLGNGTATSSAFTIGTGAFSQVFTTGPSAAFAQSIGTPFGSAVQVQVASFFGGVAFGTGTSFP